MYAQAKTLWLQQVSDNPQNTAILGNAAAFCLLYDRRTAEDLLKQAQALEPANPAWSERLAQLYSLDAQSANPGEANPRPPPKRLSKCKMRKQTRRGKYKDSSI